MPSSALALAGYELAQHGWGMFPVNGKRPPYGLRWPQFAREHDAAALHAYLMFTDDVFTGLGVACGEHSGFWVLDVDDIAALGGLIRKAGGGADLPCTVTARSGSGRGAHYYFRFPTDGRIVGCANKRLNHAAGREKGLDVRGNGGYVVVPPSAHPSGGHYEWIASPHDTPIADAPDWLLDLVVDQATERLALAEPTATPAAMERAALLLSVFPPIPGGRGRYTDWLRVAVCLKAMVGDDGEDLFRDWSNSAPSAGVPEGWWSSLRPSAHGVGPDALATLAQSYIARGVAAPGAEAAMWRAERVLAGAITGIAGGPRQTPSASATASASAAQRRPTPNQLFTKTRAFPKPRGASLFQQ